MPITQHSPGASPGTSPPKSMKHMTCYFWHRGSCKYTEGTCLYAHKEFVPERVAGPPLQKEVGMPAVAGKNALREKSVYTDWNQVHATAAGLSVYSRSQPSTSPIPSQQFANLHFRHQSEQEVQGQPTGVPGSGFVELDKLGDTSSRNQKSMSNPPPRNVINVDNSSPTAEPNVNTPLDEETAGNQAIRSAIPDLCQIIAILMKDQGVLMKKQAQAQEEVLRQILTLPKGEQHRFERPLATSTNITAKTAAGSSKVTGMIDDVRKKLVDVGLGGLLGPMNREFCTSATEALEE
ncbi:MAG: hypothetical protein Q9216_003791 [Gyalolechia sp. 2 TL-2023]